MLRSMAEAHLDRLVAELPEREELEHLARRELVHRLAQLGDVAVLRALLRAAARRVEDDEVQRVADLEDKGDQRVRARAPRSTREVAFALTPLVVRRRSDPPPLMTPS